MTPTGSLAPLMRIRCTLSVRPWLSWQGGGGGPLPFPWRSCFFSAGGAVAAVAVAAIHLARIAPGGYESRRADARVLAGGSNGVIRGVARIRGRLHVLLGPRGVVRVALEAGLELRGCGVHDLPCSRHLVHAPLADEGRGG